MPLILTSSIYANQPIKTIPSDSNQSTKFIPVHNISAPISTSSILTKQPVTSITRLISVQSASILPILTSSTPINKTIQSDSNQPIKSISILNTLIFYFISLVLTNASIPPTIFFPI